MPQPGSVFLNDTGNEPLYASDNSNDSLKKINGILYWAFGQTATTITTGGVASTSPSAAPTRLSRLDGGIQNLSTAALYVKWGDGASTTNFDFVLNGGSAQDDGLGGNRDFPTNYKGSVSVASVSGTVRYKVWEI